jgi:hypothetical protein
MEKRHNPIAFLSTPGWLTAAWAGVSYGLAIARLLYEAAPLRLAVFGAPWAALLVCLGAILIWAALLRGAVRPQAAALPPLLLWIHILAPPLDANPLRGLILLAGASALIAGSALFEAPESQSDRRRSRITLAALATLTLLAYLLTLQRTVGRADTFEFQVTAPVLGVAHPTGYPLYVLIGKLFSLLPLGKVATRVNLTSTVAALIAVALLYLVLSRVLRARPLIAAWAALAFGLSPTFWSQAVAAEVYALHNALMAASLGLALWLIGGREGEGSSARWLTPPRAVILLGALTGLSLAHHLTAVLILPGVGLAILLAWPHLTWKQWLLAAGLLILELLLYAYIPIRWPALNEGRPMPWPEFVGWITGSRFSGALQLRAWLTDPDRWRIVRRFLLGQYGPAGLILGGGGLIVLAIRRWRAALVTASVFAAYGFYGLNYLVPDIGVFLIPMALLLALWAAYGVEAGLSWLGKRLPHAWGEISQSAALAAFALIPLSTAWTTGPGFDWGAERDLEAWGRYVLSLPIKQDAVILVDGEKIAPLEYLHRIEGIRPDLSIAVHGVEEEYYAHLYAAIEAGQPVYLQRLLPGLEGSFHLRSLGPLVEVGTTPLADPPPLSGQPAAWENGIGLLGYQIASQEAPAGGAAHLTLYWRAEEPLTDNVQVRLRLVEGEAVAWESAPAYPVGDRYPTVAWKDGEVVPDYHSIPLSYALAPGDYTLEVALAPPYSDDLLPLGDGAAWAELGLLQVTAPASPPPIVGRRIALSFPGGALTGLDLPEQALGGATLRPLSSWRVADRGGTAIFWREPTLRAGDDTAPLSLPGEASPLALETTLDGGTLTWRLAGDHLRCGWLQSLADSCTLGTTIVEGEAAADAIANFGGQILLDSIAFDSGQLQPGAPLTVTVEWQSLASIDEDYTVFVQLIGPDGRPHGQVDTWPVQGTYPTSQWSPGERVPDRYAVTLDADAPSGSYQLWVGLYLLSTNTRLPVLGADGSPIDDKAAFEGLLVP